MAVERSDLGAGSVAITYAPKGEKRERLSFVNRYHFLPVVIDRIDSVSGKWMRLRITPGNRGGFAGITLPPTQTVGPVVRADKKGPAKERWPAEWRSNGLWIVLDTVDTLKAFGHLRFSGASEMAALGFDTVSAVPLAIIHVRRHNLPLFGGGAGMLLIGMVGLAWVKGRTTTQRRGTL